MSSKNSSTVYTVTISPSLDYKVSLNELELGGVNRSLEERLVFGGKGLNVTAVLTSLDVHSVSLGFIAGVTGQIIETLSRNIGLETDFIQANGLSRINLKLKSKDASDGTEINGQGVFVSQSHILDLFRKLDKIKSGDYLVLSGSVPSSMPQDIYEQIFVRLQERGICFIVDATRSTLLNVLKYHPFLIKPNHHELGEMFGVVLKSTDEIVKYARQLQDLGARNVIVSRAEDGAVMLTENGELFISVAPKGIVVDAVGAGDSFIAGFLAKYIYNSNLKLALHWGLATGSATAFKEGLATQNDILRVLEEFSPSK